MDYAKAKAIAAEHKPNLIVDPPHNELKDMFVVRRKDGAMPFSIHLPSTPSNSTATPEEAEAQEIDSLKVSLDSADQLLPQVAD